MDFIEDGGGSGAIQDSSAYDSLIGRTIANNFRLVKRIGAGAMGRVYQAEQLSLGKMVAIKILRHELMADEKLVRRFELEARTASAVSHPNLIETFDCGRDLKLDLAYIAMELLPGPDLAQVIAREAPLALQRSARIMDQVLAALEEAHGAGIVHRDLKPGNIMLVPRRDDPEFVKVCDFGIAKVKSVRARPNLTMAGLVFGTPEYMSPEQACGGDVDARTDLYAVAAILYQLVSGQLPFPAPSPTEVLARILRDDPEPPSRRGYVTDPGADREADHARPVQGPRAAAADRRRVPHHDARRLGRHHGLLARPEHHPADDLAAPDLDDPGAAPVERRAPRRGGSADAARRHAGRAAPHPRQGIINWALLFERRPTKSAILGFSLTLACGGLALWGLTRQHDAPPVEASASDVVSTTTIAKAPAAEGMIVVPAAPRPAQRSPSHSDERHAPAAKSAAAVAVRRDPPARWAVQKPAARGKQAHHEVESRATAAGAASTSDRAGSTRVALLPEVTEPHGDLAPTEAPAPPGAGRGRRAVARQRRHRPQAARHVDPVGGRGACWTASSSAARRCSAPRSTSASRTR